MTILLQDAIKTIEEDDFVQILGYRGPWIEHDTGIDPDGEAIILQGSNAVVRVVEDEDGLFVSHRWTDMSQAQDYQQKQKDEQADDKPEPIVSQWHPVIETDHARCAAADRVVNSLVVHLGLAAGETQRDNDQQLAGRALANRFVFAIVQTENGGLFGRDVLHLCVTLKSYFDTQNNMIETDLSILNELLPDFGEHEDQYVPQNGRYGISMSDGGNPMSFAQKMMDAGFVWDRQFHDFCFPESEHQDVADKMVGKQNAQKGGMKPKIK